MISTDIISHISLIPPQSIYCQNRKRLWGTILEHTSRIGFVDDSELSLVKKLSSGLSWVEMIPSEYRDIYAALYIEAKEFKISKKERVKIEKDVYRTFSLFTRYPGKSKLGQIPEFGSEKMDAYCNSLASILLASSHERGYCQGQNFLVAVFILNECTDTESFTLLNFLLTQRHLEILFNPRCSSLVEYMKVFEKRLRKNNKKVYDHLKKNGFSPVCYAIEWFTTCFITTAPGDLSLACLDMIFMGINNTLLRVGLALMDILEDKILKSNQEQLQMSFKEFVMSADPSLVIPRALSLGTKKDNVLGTMVTNIQKMNPSLDLVNTLWTPRPTSPAVNNIISSENDELDDSRCVSPLIFENQNIQLTDCSADSENDSEKKKVNVGKTTESMSSSSNKLRSMRIIRRIIILKRRRREKILLTPAYIKNRSHPINIKRKSILLGDSDNDDDIVKPNTKKGNVVALFFEEALDTTKLGLIKLFSPLHKRSESIKSSSNSSDSGPTLTARNSIEKSVYPSDNSKSSNSNFSNYGYGLPFSPFYEDLIMGDEYLKLKSEMKFAHKVNENDNMFLTCQPNLTITPFVETLMKKTTSFEEVSSPKQSLPTVDGNSLAAGSGDDNDFIFVDSVKTTPNDSVRRSVARKITRNDGETYVIKIRIRDSSKFLSRRRILTRPKCSVPWPKRIFKWPKIKTSNNGDENIMVRSRILDTLWVGTLWVGTFGVFGNKSNKSRNRSTRKGDSTQNNSKFDKDVKNKNEIRIDTNEKSITNIERNKKTGNYLNVNKGYLGDNDDDITSSESDEKTWVTRIPFSKTEKNDNINDI